MTSGDGGDTERDGDPDTEIDDGDDEPSSQRPTVAPPARRERVVPPSGRAAIATPAAGTPLPVWLAERPRSWRAIVALFAAVARELAAAHAAGDVHRDVAARHVVVDAHGVPRLGGFRAAAERGPAPAHLAPELRVAATADLRGPAAATPHGVTAGDSRADQYALAAALWHALFDAEPPARPRARRDVPAAVVAVLERGLAASPGERFATTDALADALAATTRARRGRRVAVVAATTVALGLGLGFGLGLGTGTSTTPDDIPAVPAPPPRALVDHTAELARIAQLADPAAVLRALAALPADTLALPAAGELATDAAAAGPIRVIDEAAPITSLAMMPQTQLLVVGTTVDTVVHALDGSERDRHIPIAAPSAIAIGSLRGQEVYAIVGDQLAVIAADGNVQRFPACPDHGRVLAHSIDLHALTCSTTLPSGRAGAVIVDVSSGARRVAASGLEILGSDPNGRSVVRVDDATIAQLDRYATTPAELRHAAPAHALFGVNMDGVAIAAGRSLTWWEPYGSDGDADYSVDYDFDWLGVQVGGSEIVAWGSHATGDVMFIAPPTRFAGAWHAGAPIIETALADDPPGPIVVRSADQIQELDPELGWLARTASPQVRGASAMSASGTGAIVAVARDSRIVVWLPRLAVPHTVVLKRATDVRLKISTDGADVAVAFADHVTIETLAVEAVISVPRGAAQVAWAPDHSLAALTDDGTVWTWRDDATRTLGTVAGARELVAVARDRALVIDAVGQLHAVRGDGDELACGGRRVERVAGDTAIVAGDGRALCNITAGVVRALPPAESWTLSPDGSRAAALSRGEVTVVRAADLAQLAFPRVTGVTAVAFDASGTHVVATSPSQLAVATETGTEPVVLASSAGAGLAGMSADGTRVAARLGDDIVAWDVEDPTRARPVGHLAHQPPTLPGDLVVTAQTVALAHLDLFGWHVVTSWRIGPTSPAEIHSLQRFLGP